MMKGMSFRRRLALSVLVAGVLAAGVAMRRPMLRAAGRLLVVDDPVEPVDAIVLPQWSGAAGAIDASDLVRDGKTRRLFLLPEPARRADEELARRGIAYMNGNLNLVTLLHSLGVGGVEVISDAAVGTEDEGRVLVDWCGQRQLHSVIVVSSPDHSRRVRRVLRRALRGSSTKVIVRAARFSSFDPDQWWNSRDGMRTEIVELEKLVLDVARHPFG
jgi:hypothetical protein